MRHRLHYRAVVLAAVCTLALTLTMGQYLIPFNPRAAVGGCTWTEVSDDFNRSNESLDASANWTETSGDIDIVGSEVVQQDGTGLEAAWVAEGATIAATQYGCALRSGGPTAYGGPKFRIPNLSCTGASYTVRWTSLAPPDETVVRTCTCDSCSTFATWANSIEEDNYLCAEVQGAGAATEFAVWEMTSAPGARGTWGDPDYCTCDSGNGAGCELLTGCPTPDDKEPSDSGSYQDCASGCYFGIYSGSGTNLIADNFTGGWCD